MTRAPHVTLCAGPDAGDAAAIVHAALVRAFSPAQVRVLGPGDAVAPESVAAVLVAPDAAAHAFARHHARGGRKLVVLGAPDEAMAELAGLAAFERAPVTAAEAACAFDAERPWSESAAAVVWRGEGLAAASPLRRRPFARMDHEDGWCTPGFGRIGVERGPFALSCTARAGAARVLARVRVGDADRGACATLRDEDDAAVLWLARPAGAVDGLDGCVLETFLAGHRAGELACLPLLEEIPAGFAAAATTRVDADEAVASARPLADLYRDHGFPLSLALRSDLALDAADMALLRDLLAAGGSVVSHSHTHQPGWGRDHAEALADARASRRRIEALLPELAPLRHAVSPFHRNPRHALRALVEAGFRALATGIAAHDPECLVARAGVLPFTGGRLVAHAQQCMLHGDVHRRQDAAAAAAATFAAHARAGAIFGALDHPFSARYAYGWRDEAERLAVHEALLRRLAAHEGLWRPSLSGALGFVERRAATRVWLAADGRPRVSGPPGDPPVAVRWTGGRPAAPRAGAARPRPAAVRSQG